jgi:hypothetical protein
MPEWRGDCMGGAETVWRARGCLVARGCLGGTGTVWRAVEKKLKGGAAGGK